MPQGLPGECRLGNSCKYYKCGKEDHIARDFRSAPAKAAESVPGGGPNSRVYSLNERDVEVGLSTSISGQLHVSNLKLYALIDSGATHSFIAKRLVDRLEGDKRTLNNPFITVTPTDDVYQSMSWFKDVPIRIGEFFLFANLIKIEMYGFDAILGID